MLLKEGHDWSSVQQFEKGGCELRWMESAIFQKWSKETFARLEELN